MKTVFVVLFALAIFACVALIFWRLLLPMASSTHRTLMIVIAVVGLVLCETLLILCARIPSRVDTMLTAGIGGIETHLEAVQPGYVHKEMSTTELQNILTDTKMLTAYIENTPNVSFVVQLVGVGAYVGYIKSFSGAIEKNLNEMRAEGVPVTLHNVFVRVQDLSRTPVLKTTKVLEIVVLVFSGIFILALLLIYYIVIKNESSLGESRIIMVEQPD